MRAYYPALSRSRPPHPKPVDIVLISTGLKFYGPGEWDQAKHGERRRAWRKPHVSVDPASSEIVAHELTDSDTSDAAMAGPLVAGSGGNIRRFVADDACAGAPVTKAIRAASPVKSPPKIIVPPPAKSIPPPGAPHDGSERERHATEIAAHGRMNWQKDNDYGLRSLGETGIGRFMNHTGGILRARTFGAQQKEADIDISLMNRKIRAAKPVTVRVKQKRWCIAHPPQLCDAPAPCQIHSTNPLESLNKEIKRRTNVVGIFPNDASNRRMVGALMLEQNDEWAVTRRYMALETVAAICDGNTPAKIAAL